MKQNDFSTMTENDYEYLKFFVTDEIKIEDLEALVNQGISIDDIVLLLNWHIAVEDIPTMVAKYDLGRWRSIDWDMIENDKELDIDELLRILDAEKKLQQLPEQEKKQLSQMASELCDYGLTLDRLEFLLKRGVPFPLLIPLSKFDFEEWVQIEREFNEKNQVYTYIDVVNKLTLPSPKVNVLGLIAVDLFIIILTFVLIFFYVKTDSTIQETSRILRIVLNLFFK